jgi:hypothetical protein
VTGHHLREGFHQTRPIGTDHRQYERCRHHFLLIRVAAAGVTRSPNSAATANDRERQQLEGRSFLPTREHHHPPNNLPSIINYGSPSNSFAAGSLAERRPPASRLHIEGAHPEPRNRELAGSEVQNSGRGC